MLRFTSRPCSKLRQTETACKWPLSTLVGELTEALSFVMSQKMLRGIRDKEGNTAREAAACAGDARGSFPPLSLSDCEVHAAQERQLRRKRSCLNVERPRTEGGEVLWCRFLRIVSPVPIDATAWEFPSAAA